MRSFSFSVSRRGWLRAIGALGGLALGTVLDARAEDSKSKAAGKKYTKERVGYRDEPYLGRTCAKCVLYSGDGNCVKPSVQSIQDGSYKPLSRPLFMYPSEKAMSARPSW